MLVTIFTPTYNRGYLLERLYDSLCAQTCSDFEWLIVDDGSTDNTQKIVNSFITQNKINIRFERQRNGGKHRAINFGLDLARGEYFYVVDSDDYLPSDAIEAIRDRVSEIAHDKEIAGLSGLDRTTEGKLLTNFPDVSFIDSTPFDIRLKHGIQGDMAEVLKTEIFREFRFPDFSDEKFCPEALIFNRLSNAGFKLRYFPHILKIIEYMPDGLTARIVKIRHDSPKASMLYYSELAHSHTSCMQKVKAWINFWRFAVKPDQEIHHMLNPIGLLCYLPGKAMRLRDN